MTANMEQSLIMSLLQGQPHNYSQLLSGSKTLGSPRQVRLVEDYLEAHAEEPVELVSLAKITGYSISTIYQSFKKYRGYTPMDFLKRFRLEKFRNDLLTASPEASVTRMAMDCGFMHLGRLSAVYRRRFGENPSDTLRRTKARL